LVKRLTELKAAGQEVTVWMISSGQSCTTCHTKQEIAARDLIRRGLIKKGYFATLYGATYDDTFRVAQFYDAQYADAMILRARDPENAGNLIHTDNVRLKRIPRAAQDVLGQATRPTAVIVRNSKVYAFEEDGRSSFGLNATPEASAVRSACLRNRAEGTFLSWEIDGELYTTTKKVGPLLVAEMGWTKINQVHHVEMPWRMKFRKLDARETPDINNTEFLSVVAGGYRDRRAAITVFRDPDFVNTAQPMWAKVLAANDRILYNGASVSDAALAERNVRTRFYFAAEDLSAAGSKPRVPIPLATLQDFLPAANR